jgi:hypothetical protein
MRRALIVLMLSLGQAGAAPAQTRAEGPPALVVQVVDPLWLPLPGVRVVVVPALAGSEQQIGRTSTKGYAEFWLSRGAEYAIDVHSRGFAKRRVEHVRIGKSQVSPTAYVQVQLEPRGSGGSAEQGRIE